MSGARGQTYSPGDTWPVMTNASSGSAAQNCRGRGRVQRVLAVHGSVAARSFSSSSPITSRSAEIVRVAFMSRVLSGGEAGAGG